MAARKPGNSSELQLYRVLQHANLLQYYDTFISQGGDDVQQLCEAGEEEFLEIMALVGMASKPLHVRRLQKTLQEWVANPSAFEASKKFPTHVMSMLGSQAVPVTDFRITPPQSSTISTSTPFSVQSRSDAVSPSGEPGTSEQMRDSPSRDMDYRDVMKDVMYVQESQPGTISHPQLMEHQINAIAAAAEALALELPNYEPKSLPKKQMSKEIHTVMLLPMNHPNRMTAMRKYAAIYGRFDSKRKNDRPMTLHEISVNEAAAQLCSHFPALLTRREDLFPLARQVVRRSGYVYSKGHSRAADVIKLEMLDTETQSPDSGTLNAQEELYYQLQGDLSEVNGELSELSKKQNHIREALRVMLESDDHEQMTSLTAEMDDLNDQQSEMTIRRKDLMKRISKLRKLIYKTMNAPFKTILSSASCSSPPPSAAASADNEKTNSLSVLYKAVVQESQGSLFEEGLRIATQYGMADFAEELIGMKHKEKQDEQNKSEKNAKEDEISESSKVKNETDENESNNEPSELSKATIDFDAAHNSDHFKKSIVSCSKNINNQSKIVAGEEISTVETSKKPENDKEKPELLHATSDLVENHKEERNKAEPETRRSSRKRSGEPDYYYINNGEKRNRTNSRKKSSLSEPNFDLASPDGKNKDVNMNNNNNNSDLGSSLLKDDEKSVLKAVLLDEEIDNKTEDVASVGKQDGSTEPEKRISRRTRLSQSVPRHPCDD